MLKHTVPALAATALLALSVTACGATTTTQTASRSPQRATQPIATETGFNAHDPSLVKQVEQTLTDKVNDELGYTDTQATCFATSDTQLKCHIESAENDDESNATITIDPKSGQWVSE